MDPIALSVFASRLNAICEEMGVLLRRAAFSPNIKDRLDFSCALFDAAGEICAQAAHIPVHLGSMAFAMRDVVNQCDFQPGDVWVLNDPFLGGTHLPDVTVLAPVFAANELIGFSAARAHHANIGGGEPGSMPIARRLEEEGVILPPTLFKRTGRFEREVIRRLGGSRGGLECEGDLLAQLRAAERGAQAWADLWRRVGAGAARDYLAGLNHYGKRLTQAALAALPDGRYSFIDYMDDDGLGHFDIPIAVTLELSAGRLVADFTGTAPMVAGNINCPLSVTAAAVFYVVRCLLPESAPTVAGSFEPIEINAPRGCLINAQRPAAVAAGNVETSSRIVDVVLGALAQADPAAIPAASQGTMNNLAMGAFEPPWDYYETMGGGAGGAWRRVGLSGRQSHMTNTRNTPVEVMESRYPLRVRHYWLRHDSAGAGRWPGGQGVCRAFEALAPLRATLLCERRRHAPWGTAGGDAGAPGQNRLNGVVLPGKASLTLAPGDVLEICTPGGGGYGGAGPN